MSSASEGVARNCPFPMLGFESHRGGQQLKPGGSVGEGVAEAGRPIVLGGNGRPASSSRHAGLIVPGAAHEQHAFASRTRPATWPAMLTSGLANGIASPRHPSWRSWRLAYEHHQRNHWT